MLNAYQLGFLAAQPQVFTKAASLRVLRDSVLVKFAARGVPPLAPGREAPTNPALWGPAPAEHLAGIHQAPDISVEQSLRDAIAGGGGDVQAREALAAIEASKPHKSPGLPNRDIKQLEEIRPTMTDPEFHSPLTDRPPPPESIGTRAGKAIDEGTAYATEKAKGGWDWLKQKATDIGTSAKGFSSDVNVALGGAKDKHTRTLMALAALLAAGGGAYALGRSGGGGEGKRERA